MKETNGGSERRSMFENGWWFKEDFTVTHDACMWLIWKFRNAAEKMWKEGKLVGMFNITFENKQLFNACQDFCIEEKEKHGIDILQYILEALLTES